jgi:hypothetical protein
MGNDIKYLGGHGDMGPTNLKDAKCPMILLAGYHPLGDSGPTIDQWRDRYHPKTDPNG